MRAVVICGSPCEGTRDHSWCMQKNRMCTREWLSCWGRPQRRGPTTRRSLWRPGATGRQHHRSRHGNHACTDVVRSAPFFSGPVGDSGVIPSATPVRKEADAVTIPGLPTPSQLQHRKLSLRDTAARAMRGCLGHGDVSPGGAPIGERTTTHNEHNRIQEMKTPTRLSTANDEVVASKR